MAVGAGYYESEHRTRGIHYADTRTRAERLPRGHGGAGRRATQRTRHVERPALEDGDAPMYPDSVQKPHAPLWVAAQVPFQSVQPLPTGTCWSPLATSAIGRDHPAKAPQPIRSPGRDVCRGRARRGPDAARVSHGVAEDRSYQSDQAFIEFVGSFRIGAHGNEWRLPRHLHSLGRTPGPHRLLMSRRFGSWFVLTWPPTTSPPPTLAMLGVEPAVGNYAVDGDEAARHPAHRLRTDR